MYITKSKTAVFIFPALVKHFCMFFGSMAGANEFSILQPTIIPFNVLDCRQGTAQGQHFVRPVQQPLYPIPRFSQGSSCDLHCVTISASYGLKRNMHTVHKCGLVHQWRKLAPPKNVFASWSPSLDSSSRRYDYMHAGAWPHQLP